MIAIEDADRMAACRWIRVSNPTAIARGAEAVHGNEPAAEPVCGLPGVIHLFLLPGLTLDYLVVNINRMACPQHTGWPRPLLLAVMAQNCHSPPGLPSEEARIPLLRSTVLTDAPAFEIKVLRIYTASDQIGIWPQ